ncbi:hypothetical protein [Caldimonas brevitalea]|uniref:Uncharacterized protein n=1 Tax=Caldimonas brevitalea TaxID=413882 RepID=A0A0G3BLS0_9BURK|nr:hypothetical protein [Caldimonas brevitalea]AKJ30342.1 hypothetical protein AAW51_3651 [Caldimonas brevitalea]
MQIAPLDSGLPALRRAPGTDRPAAAAAGSTQATATSAPLAGAGLRGWQPQFNGQVAGAQQALGFLDEADSQLQQLKATLSGKLAKGEAGDSGTAEALQRFEALWRRRSEASAASLDGQLAYQGKGGARQQFKIRGLDLKAVRAGAAETLAISVGASGQRAVRVHIDPALGDAEVAARLDQALAPIGIRAGLDTQGRLGFSTPETNWPAVRDGLAMQGGGIRFPSGRFHSVRTEPEPQAVRPEGWQGNDRAALRQTLQQVVDALDRVRRSRDAIQQALDEAARQVDPPVAAVEGSWASTFTAEFESASREPGYQLLSAIAPALIGIDRQRVMALLGLTA